MREQSKNLLMLFFIVISILTHLNMSAQVTIGSNEPPVEGALLQLKELSGAGGGINSLRGLGLPRISLSMLNDLDDVVGTSKPEGYKEAHIGLVIFNVPNTAICPIFEEGVYVWNGQKWNPLIDPYREIKKFIDKRDGVTYKYRKFGKAGDWMIENLRATRYDDNEGGGSLIESRNNTSTTTVIKYYYYPSATAYNNINSDKEYFDKNKELGVGLLYTYYAAANGSKYTDTINYINSSTRLRSQHATISSRLQGICPDGWYLPSDADWADLEEVIASDSKSEYSFWNSNIVWKPEYSDIAGWRVNGLGSLMKSCFMPEPKQKTGGLSKQNGFNVMLLGFIDRSILTEYSQIGSFYTSTMSTNQALNNNRNPIPGNAVWMRFFGYSTNQVYRDIVSTANMYSVRCRRN